MANKVIYDIATGIETTVDEPLEPKTPQELDEEERMARIMARSAAVRDEMQATSLRTVTPEQADAWIESTVVDLATAKVALKKLARMAIATRDAVDPGLAE